MTDQRKDGSNKSFRMMDCREDTDLFIQAANMFVPAKVQVHDDGGLYLCWVNGRGLFVKTVKKSKELRLLFEGTFLVCRYKKGEFNEDWVLCLTLSYQDGEGSLKDVLEDLLLDDEKGK